MKVLIVAASLVVSSAALAQQADLRNDIINSLQTQRNNALDQAAVMKAQLDGANRELATLKSADEKLKSDLADVKKQLDEAKKPPVIPPKENK